MSIGLGAVTNTIKSAGKAIWNNKLNASVLAISVLPALFAYGYEYDTNGQKVEGTNWSCGNSSLMKNIGKYLGFTVSGSVVAAAFCGAPLVLGLPLAAAGLYLGFCQVPEWLDKLMPDEGEQVKKACEEKGVAYNPPSLMGSLAGGDTVTA